jgi:hypothetical protein
MGSGHLKLRDLRKFIEKSFILEPRTLDIRTQNQEPTSYGEYD